MSCAGLSPRPVWPRLFWVSPGAPTPATHRRPIQWGRLPLRRRAHDQHRRHQRLNVILPESGERAGRTDRSLAQRRRGDSPCGAERRLGRHGQPGSRRVQLADGARLRGRLSLHHPSGTGRHGHPLTVTSPSRAAARRSRSAPARSDQTRSRSRSPAGPNVFRGSRGLSVRILQGRPRRLR